jgi:hypothetical protein
MGCHTTLSDKVFDNTAAELPALQIPPTLPPPPAAPPTLPDFVVRLPDIVRPELPDWFLP